MGIFAWLFGKFINVIEWKDSTKDTIVWRYPREDSEIKYGAKLIVRESQIAIFVDKEKIADVLTPGTYKLESDNLPILSDLQHWDYDFESPFKADVYFINSKKFSQKWGTKNPILLKDSEFDIVRLKAFGSYEFRVKEPIIFLKEIVGEDGHFKIEKLDEQLTNLILSKLPSILAENEQSILYMSKNLEKFGKFLKDRLDDEFNKYGLKLEKFLIENISIPQEIEEAIGKRTAKDLDKHLKYESTGEIADLAVNNEVNKSLKKEQKPSSPKVPVVKPFYIVKNGKADGPHELEEIVKMIQKKELKKDSYVWQEGLEGWVKANALLSNFFEKLQSELPKS